MVAFHFNLNICITFMSGFRKILSYVELVFTNNFNCTSVLFTIVTLMFYSSKLKLMILESQLGYSSPYYSSAAIMF